MIMNDVRWISIYSQMDTKQKGKSKFWGLTPTHEYNSDFSIVLYIIVWFNKIESK